MRYAWFWLAVAGFIYLVATHRKRIASVADRALVAMSFLVLPLALRSMRNMVPFALLAAPTISRVLWRQGAEDRIEQRQSRLAGPVLRGLLLFASLVVAGILVAHRWTANPPPAEWRPLSDEAIAGIRSCGGRIYNHYNDGGYLVWFIPEQKLFLDSRQDPYPPGLIRAQKEAERSGDYAELFKRYSLSLCRRPASIPSRGST